jgi:hypothetical protein
MRPSLTPAWPPRPARSSRGHDGFSYFVLNLPAAGQSFETFCVSHILDVCLQNGFGVVIEPQANPPQWVFPYGRLWSLKELGRFQVQPVSPGGEKSDELPEGDTAPVEILAGLPSVGFFPPYARKAIKHFLAEKTGNAIPQVLLVTDPRKAPVPSLVFSVFAEDFARKKEFEEIMYRLTWFLPSHYGLLSIAKDSELAKLFAPL